MIHAPFRAWQNLHKLQQRFSLVWSTGCRRATVTVAEIDRRSLGAILVWLKIALAWSRHSTVVRTNSRIQRWAMRVRVFRILLLWTAISEQIKHVLFFFEAIRAIMCSSITFALEAPSFSRQFAVLRVIFPNNVGVSPATYASGDTLPFAYFEAPLFLVLRLSVWPVLS